MGTWGCLPQTLTRRLSLLDLQCWTQLGLRKNNFPMSGIGREKIGIRLSNAIRIFERSRRCAPADRCDGCFSAALGSCREMRSALTNRAGSRGFNPLVGVEGAKPHPFVPYQTLNLNRVISPSCITYSLPSERIRPFSRQAAMLPNSFRLSKGTISARMKPRSKSVWILPAA